MRKLRRGYLYRHPLFVGALALGLVASGAGLELASPTGAQPPSFQVLTSGFSGPFAVSSDGSHVWVANNGNESVTELDASTGALVQVLSGSSYGFGFADGIAEAGAISSDGVHVWTANPRTNSVTELDASTGALVKVLSGSSYGFSGPINLSSDGTHVWVANSSNNSVTEIDAATGAPVQVFRDPSYGFLQPGAIASDGTHVWVQNGTHFVGTGWTPFTITELEAATGALVQVLSGIYSTDISSDGTHVWASAGGDVIELDASTGATIRTIAPSGLAYSQAVSSDGTDVWVVSTANNEIAELDASTGAVLDVISGSAYNFDFPSGISSDGENVWVANANNNSVTDISTGILAQRIHFTTPAPSNALVGGSYTVTATGGASGNPVTFSIHPSAGSVCSISGQMVTFEAPGTCTVDADQAAGNGYPAAPQVQQSFVVGAQKISFTSTPPPNAFVGEPAYDVTATGGASGNPVTFSIDTAATSVCSISGATVTATGAGLCVIDANQAAGNNYGAAPQARQSFMVGAQTITFTSTPPTDPPIGATYTVKATGGGSGNQVTFTSDDTAICTVSGSTYTFVGDGWCNIVANQAGNADWLPATTALQASLVGGGVGVVGCPQNGTFVITTCSVPPATVGKHYSAFQLRAAGAVLPYKWTLTGGALPPGLHLKARGILTGNPNKHDTAKTYNFSVEATSNHRHSLQTTPPQALTLTLEPRASKPRSTDRHLAGHRMK